MQSYPDIFRLNLAVATISVQAGKYLGVPKKVDEVVHTREGI